MSDPHQTPRSAAEIDLLERAAKLLCGLGLSAHTNAIPRAQAEALELSERLRELVRDPGPRDGVALSQRVGRWPV